MNNRILITSIAGLAGLVVSKTLIKDYNLELFGIDVVDYLIGVQEKIKYTISPLTTSVEYYDFIKNFIHDYRIDIIIPVSSHDIDFFSINKDYFSQYCKLLILDRELHNKMNNKPEAYKILNEVGLLTPKIYTDNLTVEYPAILKPVRSSGSKDSFEILDERDLTYYRGKFKNSFLSEYILGDEYTCDCFFDKKGKCSGYVVRKREKVVSGAVVKSTNFEIDVSDTIHRLEKIKGLIGPINFQFKIVNGQIIIFDLNDRMASGGLALTIELGLNIPKMIIDELEGRALNHKLSKRRLTMIRFYDEYFIEK